MNYLKHNAMIIFSTIFIIIANYGLFFLSGVDSTNRLRIEKGVFVEAAHYRSTSDLVYENAYYFNVDGLERHMKAFIERFEKQAPFISACISLKLSSVDGHQQAERVACTREDTLAMISAMPTRETSRGQSQLKIGDLDLGKIQWVVSNRVGMPWYEHMSPNPYLFFLFALCQLGVFWYVHRYYEMRRDRQIAALREIPASPGETISDVRLRNIQKIISKNKRGFVLNKDFLYATYKHPYATLHFTNGTKQNIRCSMAELENSFSDQYLKISRACVINTEIIGEYSQIKLGRSDKDHVLMIDVKGETTRQEIGAVYFASLKDKLMKVSSNKAKIEPDNNNEQVDE
ncbi:hypothetical protein P3602_21405 [Vibrio parahaemolyticus]|uniref:hypothetical protein n=1 Tax=Vibrio TaxID=662 RepID=UPI001CDBB897|nr:MULTISPECIES: hypothetical protein [Vibrio]MDF5108468.1 hypothetical protein [Vibrio parahaemolyticus]MCA2420866.1 hypothetical protein [Vibrio alginolyticus]MCA2445640.1 hypothetical protein [Vibrio alginolyticus]MDF5143373.1 hypothetical protein [Vibrio parahaemolyticus]MDF5153799.1 hypothetical protein [Vibrio parahaemolyticus]